MAILLEKADLSQAQEIYALQIASFAALLSKYQDYDYSPGAEELERTLQRPANLLRIFTSSPWTESISGRSGCATSVSCAN